MPVGDRRSVSRASRDGMWWGMHVGRAQRHERWFRAPARCRSETGAPFRAPAGMGCGAEFTLAGRRVMSAGFALPRVPTGGRRSLACGAALPGGGSAQLHFHSKRWCDTHGGRAQRHRRGFRAPARADRRSAFPGLRAAPPGGVRRNCIFTARGGVTLTGAGRSVIGAGFALPRDAGLKTGAPPLAADPRPARGGVSTAGQ